jgi:DNA-binding response OmpR family regulator
MTPSSEASAVRVAFIDDDSGLITVLARRFDALGWEREILGYAPGPDQLAALRLHALIINPSLTGVDYIERIAASLPGLAMLVCTGPAPLADRVRGLRGGADDWLTKPCHPEELVARIEAVLRRRRAGDLPAEGTTLAAGGLQIRPDRFQAFAGDHSADLTRKEFELLRLLAAADGRVLEREEIYQRVWGYTMVRGDRSVDVFVRKLRQKLERVSPDWRYVHTHFGVGYRFAAEPAEAQAAHPQPTSTTEPTKSPPPTHASNPPPPTHASKPPGGPPTEGTPGRLAHGSVERLREAHPPSTEAGPDAHPRTTPGTSATPNLITAH